MIYWFHSCNECGGKYCSIRGRLQEKASACFICTRELPALREKKSFQREKNMDRMTLHVNVISVVKHVPILRNGASCNKNGQARSHSWPCSPNLQAVMQERPSLGYDQAHAIGTRIGWKRSLEPVHDRVQIKMLLFGSLGCDGIFSCGPKVDHKVP